MVHFILFNLFSEKFILLSFPQNSVFTSPAERIHFSSRAYLLPFPQNSVFTSPAERIHFSSRAYLLPFPQNSVFTSPSGIQTSPLYLIYLIFGKSSNYFLFHKIAYLLLQQSVFTSFYISLFIH